MHNSGKMRNRSGADLSESHCYASKTDRAWKVNIGKSRADPNVMHLSGGGNLQGDPG